MLDADNRAPAWLRPGLGAAVWVGRVAVFGVQPTQTAWAVTLLALSPLVLAPIVVERLLREAVTAAERRLWLWVRFLQIPAALLLVGGIAQPPSLRATLLAVPWLLVTAWMAAIGGWRVRRRGLTPIPELCLDAGLLFLPIGAAWLCLWRMGLRPLGFEDVIVLLTAIHFHYAGFLLPLLAGWSGRLRPGRAANVAGVGVIVGVPAVAAGITATQLGLPPVVEAVAATALALAGIATAGLQLTAVRGGGVSSAARRLCTVSSVALVLTMGLAALYGWRFAHRWEWLDIPWMRAWHGTGNALGACLLGVLGHTLNRGHPGTFGLSVRVLRTAMLQDADDRSSDGGG